MKRTLTNGSIWLIVLIVGFLCILHVHSQCSPPPTLKPGSVFVSKPNCSGAYNNGTMRCHCWGHCGFICDPEGGAASSSTTTTKRPTTAATTKSPVSTTAKSTTATATTTTKPPCNPPTKPNSSITLKPNCIGAFTTSTHQCHCWGMCALICDPK